MMNREDGRRVYRSLRVRARLLDGALVRKVVESRDDPQLHRAGEWLGEEADTLHHESVHLQHDDDRELHRPSGRREPAQRAEVRALSIDDQAQLGAIEGDRGVGESDRHLRKPSAQVVEVLRPIPLWTTSDGAAISSTAASKPTSSRRRIQ